MTHLSPSHLFVLNELKSGPVTQKHLLAMHSGFSVPAIYLAIRDLVQKKIIIKTGNNISMNVLWIQNEIDILNELLVEHVDIGKNKRAKLNKFPTELNPGDRLHYKFTSYAELDTMWGSITITLVGTHKNQTPDYYYVWDPVPFWFLYSEQDFVQSVKMLRTHKYDALYSYLPLSHTLLSTIATWSKSHQIRTSALTDTQFPNNKTYNVFGDYVVTADLGQLYTAIYTLFTTRPTATIDDLHDMLNTTVCDMKLTIEHNAKKAAKLKKVFKKYFAI